MFDKVLPTSNKLLYWLFAIVLLLPMVNYYIAAIFWAFNMPNPFAEPMFAITYICGFTSYFRMADKSKLVSILILGFLLLISFVITPSTWEEVTGPVLLQSQLITFLLMYFPLFLFATEKSFNFEIALAFLYKLSIPVVALCVGAYYCQVFISGMGLQEYMTFAYTGLPAITIVTFFSWKKGDRISQVLSALACLSVLFGGCRGVLFTLAIFLITSLLLNIKSSKTRFGVFFIGIVIVLFADQFLSFVGNAMDAAGYESRIFKLVEAGEAIESEGRNVVFDKAVSLIGFFGNGLFSDRYLLNHVQDAIYCHNWVLEILVDFGYLFGVPIIIWLIALFFSALKKAITSTSDYFVFYFIFAVTFLGGKYMLSNSYLHSSEIPIILAWLISTKKHINNPNNKV